MIDTICEIENAVSRASADPAGALEDLTWMLSTPTWYKIPAWAINAMVQEEFTEDLIEVLEDVRAECPDYDYPIVEEMINILLHNTGGE